jgi:DNA-binding GntR family transcriptional regulator
MPSHPAALPAHTPTLSPIQTDNLTDRVFEQIRSAITTKVFPPGARLTEAKLAEDLNVSKTPVREAFVRLREIGLIEPDGRRGGRVVQPSRATIAEMYEVREALEVQVALLAAERAGPQAKAIIKGAAARSLAGAEADDRHAFGTADLTFHEAVAASAQNDRLEVLVRNSLDLIAAVRQRDFEHIEASRECAEAHVAVADAIARGDGPAAAEHMRAHVRYVRDMVLAQISDADIVD